MNRVCRLLSYSNLQVSVHSFQCAIEDRWKRLSPRLVLQRLPDFPVAVPVGLSFLS